MLHKDEDSEELLDDELLLDDGQSDASDGRTVPDWHDMHPQSDDIDSNDNDGNDEDVGNTGDSEDPDNGEDTEIGDRDDDFYNDDDYEEPVRTQKPKVPKLDPEDPDYWLDEQSEFGHIMPKPRSTWKWWLVGIMAIIVAVAGGCLWFFKPYVDGAVKYGYIKSMERHGTLVKTFEGVLIPYRELGDKTPTYFEEIPFSVDGDSLAAHMKGMMLKSIPVRIEYEIYHQPLFWKGASPMIVVEVDTADINRILPPEYR